MKEDRQKELFEIILNKTYKNLIEKLKINSYTKNFLKNKDFKFLIMNYKNFLNKNFELFLNCNFSELKNEIIAYTQKFDNNGIEYSSYLEVINFVELSFLKSIFENINDYSFCNLESFFIKINEFFNFIRNYSALSYLQDCIDREKLLLSEYILGTIRENDKELFNYINYFLNLTDNFLNFIKNEDLKFNEKINLFNIKHRINSIEEKEAEKLTSLLDNLNYIIEQIIKLKKEKNYLLLIEKYNEFMKNSLIFLSFIITHLAMVEIKKLKLDPLTKTLTRTNLESLILGIEDISIISNMPFGLAFLDIDNFKRINDTYGHLAGDEVLKKVAEIIKNKIRLSDYLFRYGGEEFVIVFSAIKDTETLKEKLDEIRKTIASTFIDVEKEQKINITVSIGGILVKLSKRMPIKNLIEKADELMYKAKKSGKNKVIVDEYCKI
ncbi:diguanylate cyclase [Lebetimonas natsushimae]|uniref:diguanylate cyclase n=1 Tax=Lebetimonas natsushimae TaxID=1936991 RepID=A0A292YEK7_9BACT|nr:GGDEF domain-containing protein [Lebetimonas natsushimae]GAX88267.1 diguanylate cyclase [Lebetimonas natsushimae]